MIIALFLLESAHGGQLSGGDENRYFQQLLWIAGNESNAYGANGENSENTYTRLKEHANMYFVMSNRTLAEILLFD